MAPASGAAPILPVANPRAPTCRPRRSRRSPRHPYAHSLSLLVLRVGVSPPGARASVPLPLAPLCAAHPLPIPSARVRTKPSTANAARAGTDHPPSSPPPPTPALRSADQARTHSGKQTRVNSRERRRRCAHAETMGKSTTGAPRAPRPIPPISALIRRSERVRRKHVERPAYQACVDASQHDNSAFS
jgi:hypothetical protein